MVHRSELLKCLYETLSEDVRERVHTGRHVVTVKPYSDAIEVHCSDGTMERGSIVIGADGVNSRVRRCMNEMAIYASRSSCPVQSKPYTASFRLLYGAASLLPTIEQALSWEAHGSDMSTQLFVGKDKMWFFWYEKLEVPTQQRISYTDDDEKSFVERWGHVHITDQIQLKDVYAAKTSSGMTLIEEGIVEDWSNDRTVLVGDAAFKTSVNLAFGFNGGVQALVALVNGLQELLRDKEDHPPNANEVHRVFLAYQQATMTLVTRFVAASGEITRMSTWSTWKDWLMDRYILGPTKADYRTYHEKIGPMLAQSLVLSYLAENNLPECKMPWKNFSNVD